MLQCQVDFSPAAPGSGISVVQITKEDQGRLQSQIDGEVSNQNVTSEEYLIRPDLNLKTESGSLEFEAFNPAEQFLVVVQLFLDKNNEMVKEVPYTLNIPFDVTQVKKMKIYDLLGSANKFGGIKLSEAYDQNGKQLGRVFYSLLMNGCY